MCTYSNVARELWKFTVVVECLCRAFFLSRNISLMQKKILSFLILLLLIIPIQNLIASTWAHAIRAKTYYKKNPMVHICSACLKNPLQALCIVVCWYNKWFKIDHSCMHFSGKSCNPDGDQCNQCS